MKEEFHQEGWRDFKARYEGTFGWYEKEDGSKVLVNLTAVVDRSLVFRDKAGFSYTALADKGNTFHFLPVEKACYNTADDVLYCARVPKRQWKRGLCGGNTIIHSFGQGWYHEPNFALLEQIFQPPKVTVYDKFVETLEGSAALSHSFVISKGVVYCYNHKIGTYTKGSITLTNDMFKQELSDLIRDKELRIQLK